MIKKNGEILSFCLFSCRGVFLRRILKRFVFSAELSVEGAKRDAKILATPQKRQIMRMLIMMLRVGGDDENDNENVEDDDAEGWD